MALVLPWQRHCFHRFQHGPCHRSCPPGVGILLLNVQLVVFPYDLLPIRSSQPCAAMFCGARLSLCKRPCWIIV